MSGAALLHETSAVAVAVAFALLPLAAFFVAFQLLFLRLPRREVSRIVAGTLLAAAGLFLFLLGVNIGFVPFGRAIGQSLSSSPEWLLIGAGTLLGFVTAWGEPAVRVLADQAEKASSGSIRRSLVLYAVCIGVALAVGLGMIRISHALPLLWLVVPGYVLVLCIMWFSDKAFVSIAIDAGGVATGPLANTFLLALALGVSSAMRGRNPLVDGFGLVALIALAPVVTVIALGLLVRRPQRRKES